MKREPLTIRDAGTVRQQDGLWDIKEVAAYLKCTPRTIWHRIKNDGLPFKKVGRRVLFRPSEVDAWVNKREGQAA